MARANPICRRLLTQAVERACALALHNAGNNNPLSTPTMPMTTSSSVNVKPFLRWFIGVVSLVETRVECGVLLGLVQCGSMQRPLFTESNWPAAARANAQRPVVHQQRR